MRSRTIVTLILISSVLVTCVALGTMLIIRRVYSNNARDWAIHTESPNRMFQVDLKGETAPPARLYYPHGMHKVSYSLARYGEPVLHDIPLYGGGVYDDLFLDLFPVQEWITDKTLRLGANGDSKDQIDIIRIANNSTHEIDVLETRFGNSNFFLTFGLAPKEEINIQAAVQTDEHNDSSGLRCIVRSGRRTIEQLAGFDIRARYQSPATYLVNIQESSISITSDRFPPLNLNKQN